MTSPISTLYTRLALSMIAMSTLLMSCDADEFSIQVQGILPLDVSSCGAGQLSTTNTLLSSGTMDLVLSNEYEVILSVLNRLQNSLITNNLSADDGHINTTDVNLTNAIVRYLDPDEIGLGFEAERNIPLAGLLPSSSSNPSTQRLKLITESMANNLRDGGLFNGRNRSGRVAPTRVNFTLIVAIKLQGKTLDGKRVESNEIMFPVELCTACRVSTLGRSDTCDMMSDEEADLISQCPIAIGHDDTFASCALCQQVAVNDSFAALCAE